jgi:hypothetical protein
MTGQTRKIGASRPVRTATPRAWPEPLRFEAGAAEFGGFSSAYARPGFS